MVIIRTGLAITHLNRPEYSFMGSSEKLYAKITGHIDALIGIKKTNFTVIPGLLYMHQGPASEILPGCYLRYTLREQSHMTGNIKSAYLSIGSLLRIKDAFIPSIQLEVAEYTLGLSYDINVSGFKTATSSKGGMEISLRYAIPKAYTPSAASFQ